MINSTLSGVIIVKNISEPQTKSKAEDSKLVASNENFSKSNQFNK